MDELEVMNLDLIPWFAVKMYLLSFRISKKDIENEVN